jgi:hypothetical protein
MTRPDSSGLVGEFSSPEAMIAGVRALRLLGLRRLDALSPYPVHGVEEALGLPRPLVPRWAFFGGLLGGSSLYLLQWWINVVDYPLDIGGRPLHAVPAFIPWTFEGLVLGGGTLTFLALLWACGLPRLWHPLFEVEGFDRVTADRYFVTADASDPAYDATWVEAALREAGALAVRRVGA